MGCVKPESRPKNIDNISHLSLTANPSAFERVKNFKKKNDATIASQLEMMKGKVPHANNVVCMSKNARAGIIQKV